MEQTSDIEHVYLVVVKLKSIDRIVRIDSVHANMSTASSRREYIYLDPRERAEIVAKVVS